MRDQVILSEVAEHRHWHDPESLCLCMVYTVMGNYEHLDGVKSLLTDWLDVPMSNTSRFLLLRGMPLRSKEVLLKDASTIEESSQRQAENCPGCVRQAGGRLYCNAGQGSLNDRAHQTCRRVPW